MYARPGLLEADSVMLHRMTRSYVIVRSHPTYPAMGRLGLGKAVLILCYRMS